eukprot:snap_masked-scaffold_67-processed-gene-0.69-mRNA-1 protein AED:1.00 eAED:1.00 QI:0/-1/0/0/-1/1/1/0/126
MATDMKLQLKASAPTSEPKEDFTNPWSEPLKKTGMIMFPIILIGISLSFILGTDPVKTYIEKFSDACENFNSETEVLVTCDADGKSFFTCQESGGFTKTKCGEETSCNVAEEFLIFPSEEESLICE